MIPILVLWLFGAANYLARETPLRGSYSLTKPGEMSSLLWKFPSINATLSNQLIRSFEGEFHRRERSYDSQSNCHHELHEQKACR